MELVRRLHLNWHLAPVVVFAGVQGGEIMNVNSLFRWTVLGLVCALLMTGGVDAREWDGWVDTQHGQPRGRLQVWSSVTGRELTAPPWFPLHYDVIAGKPLMILSAPLHPLLDSEIEALHLYVANGGTLLVANSWTGHVTETTNLGRVAESFGATFNFDIMLRTDPEAGRPSRVASSINTLRHNVWFDVVGVDVDLTGFAVNEMGTVSLREQWDIRGVMQGEVGRWSVSGTEIGTRLPAEEAVVFAARRYGHGAVILFSNLPDLERPAARELISSLLDWGEQQASPQHLLGEEQQLAWQAVFDLQLAVEEVYWDHPTGLAATMVEQAWSAYIDGDYQRVHALVETGHRSLERPFRPLPSRQLLLLLAVLLVAAGYARDYVPRWLGNCFAGAALSTLAGIMIYVLSLSMVSLGQLLDFLTRVVLILAAYGVAILTRPLDMGKWLFRIAVLGLVLSMAYVEAIPDAQTQDRAFLEHNLINPDSAPVRLIADEFRRQHATGVIDEVPYRVEQFVTDRVRYRQEDIDLHMSPVETLRYMEEDCDGIAILTASILENLGYLTEIKVNQHHAWVETTDAVVSYRLHAPQRTVLYSFDREGYTSFNVTGTIIEFIRKMYTGPIFVSFMLAYWPKKFDRVFLSDVFILFVLSLLIVSVPLGLASLNKLLVYFVFPVYFFLLRLMLGWLKQSYAIKIRVVAALLLVGSLTFGLITLVSLIIVLGGAGHYLLMVLLMLPLLAALVVGVHGFYYHYIEHELRLIGAVMRGNSFPQAYSDTEG